MWYTRAPSYAGYVKEEFFNALIFISMDIKSNTRTLTHTLTQMSSSDVDPRHNPGILTTCDKHVEALNCQHNNNDDCEWFDARIYSMQITITEQ